MGKGKGNQKGGRGGGKGGSAKHVHSVKTSTNKLEVYAVATRMCGNGEFVCMGVDGEQRQCHIRGKFTGKNRRSNMVCPGGWVLVGDREWSERSVLSKRTEMRKCDLLEVYDNNAKKYLKDLTGVAWSVLINADPTRTIDKVSAATAAAPVDDIHFMDEREEEMNLLMEGLKKDGGVIGKAAAAAKPSGDDVDLDEDVGEICVDDI